MNIRRLFLYGAIVAILIAASVVAYYQWPRESAVDRFARELKDLEKESYQEGLRDTHGGTTAPETLSLYIQAVERGDYTAASFYLPKHKREDEEQKLQAAAKNGDTLTRYLSFLRNAQPWPSQEGATTLTMEAPTDLGPSMFIYFELYPSGVWKIIGI